MRFSACHHVAPSLPFTHRKCQDLDRLQLWIYGNDVPHMAEGKWLRHAHSCGQLSGAGLGMPVGLRQDGHRGGAA